MVEKKVIDLDKIHRRKGVVKKPNYLFSHAKTRKSRDVDEAIARSGRGVEKPQKSRL